MNKKQKLCRQKTRRQQQTGMSSMPARPSTYSACINCAYVVCCSGAAAFVAPPRLSPIFAIRFAYHTATISYTQTHTRSSPITLAGSEQFITARFAWRSPPSSTHTARIKSIPFKSLYFSVCVCVCVWVMCGFVMRLLLFRIYIILWQICARCVILPLLHTNFWTGSFFSLFPHFAGPELWLERSIGNSLTVLALSANINLGLGTTVTIFIAAFLPASTFPGVFWQTVDTLDMCCYLWNGNK